MADPDLTLVSEASLPAHLNTTLNSAKTYADTKKTEATTQAAMDATTKADAAKVAAISDATNKYGALPAKVLTLEEEKWRGEYIGDGKNLNDYTTQRNHRVKGPGVANIPVQAPGNLQVVGLDFNFVGQTYTTYESTQRVFSRYYNRTTWSGWILLSTYLPAVNTATDINTLTEVGRRNVSTTNATNGPVPGVSFSLDTFHLGAVVGQMAMTYETKAGLYHRRQTGSGYTPWEKLATSADILAQAASTLQSAKQYTDEKLDGIAGAAGSELVGKAGKRDEYEDVVRRGKGGVIGTNGKAAFAIRFDHNLDPFKNTLWPVLYDRGVPGSFHVVSDAIGNPTDGYEPTTSTWNDVISIHRRGCDIWAHSATHGDPGPDSSWEHEIISPRDAITSKGMRCMGWSTPGPPASYGGSLNTPDKIDSLQGRLIRANYGLYEMSMLGTQRRVLPTNGCRGLDHITIDSMSATEVKAVIDEAVKFRYGVEFMIHPIVVGQPGRISLADFTEVVDYLAALRQSGEALLLTSSGLAFADPNTARRFDLIPNGGSGEEVTFPVRQFGMDGHTFELVGKVRAAAGGTARFTVYSNGDTQLATRDISVPASSSWQTVHIPFLAAMRDANTVRLTFTGDGVEWSELHAYPI